jgi:hypothetical protein
MTLLYRIWIRKQFRAILKRSSNPTRHTPLPEHFRERARAARFILQNIHHVPIRVLQGDHGFLSSAVVLDENTHWWRQLEKEVRQRRRPMTQSLAAQIFWVVTAQIFVWAATFQKAGDTFTGLGLSTGMVLLWMLPVVWGTFTVGNFQASDSISDAVSASENHFVLAGDTMGPPQPPKGREKSAISQRDPEELPLSVPSPDAPSPPEISPPARSFSNRPRRLPIFWYRLVQGDEIETGVTMNHARIHTSRTAARHIIDAFRAAKRKIEEGEAPVSARAQRDVQDPERYWGTRNDISQFCDCELTALPVFKDLRRKGEAGEPPLSLVAFGVALWAQVVTWGALGAGIFIAYQTPTVGLGCYSGSILIYGIASSASFFLFLFTSSLSWSYMNNLEDIERKDNWLKRTLKSYGLYCPSGPHRKRIGRWLHRGLCVTTRIGGKTIAICSAFWEILSTILTYSRVFGTCWCDTVFFSRRNTAYTTIFVDTSMISHVSRHVWMGGLFLTVILCLIAAILFSLKVEPDGREKDE